MGSSLSGINVLVTRPYPQHLTFCSAIKDLKGNAIHFPLIKVEAIDNDEKTKIVNSKIQNLDNFNILIFISTNAVQFGAERINSYWPQFPVGIDVIAVGPSTARKVCSELSCPVIHSELGASSEDLLELNELKEIEDKKIAIFRGDGGRELLAESLTARKAQVDYIEVYKRTAVNYSKDELRDLINTNSINVYSVTSGESLNRLYELISGSTDLLRIPLVVPSARVAELAEQKGFAIVKNADGADVDASINALQELAN